MKSLYEQLTELTKKFHQYPNINKVSTKTYYQNINDESDMFLDADEFINRKLNGADYKKVVIMNTPKRDFFKEFFGDADYKVTKETKSDMHIVKLMFAEAGLISPLAVNPEQASLPIDNVTAFKKEKQAAQAKIQNVKNGNNQSLTLEQAQAELVAVYAKYKKPYKPRVKKAEK